MSKERDPVKLRARSLASAAVKAGRLIRKPCERCGEQKSQKHHPDYSKPLDVVWLCRPCHEIEHHGPIERRRKLKIWVAFTRAEKRLIVRAAAICGVSANQFIREAALKKADSASARILAMRTRPPEAKTA